MSDLKNKAVPSVIRHGFALLLAVLLPASLCVPACADHNGDNHAYEYVLLQEPTCLEEGLGVYSCYCGDMFLADPIPALGHAWDNGTETLAPAEVSEGIMVYTCTRCGALQYESIPVLPPAPENAEDIDEPEMPSASIQVEEYLAQPEIAEEQEDSLPEPEAAEEQADNLSQPETAEEQTDNLSQPETGHEQESEETLPEVDSPQNLEEDVQDQEEDPLQEQQNNDFSELPEEESLTPGDEEKTEELAETQPEQPEAPSSDFHEEEEGPSVPEDTADWIVHFPENRPIPYLSQRTEIGTITVESGRDYPDNQILLVQLDYSSFSSEVHSIPIIITAVQNGIEQYWPAGIALPMKLNGSDPITVYINVADDAWRAAPSGSYALELNYHAFPVE